MHADTLLVHVEADVANCTISALHGFLPSSPVGVKVRRALPGLASGRPWPSGPLGGKVSSAQGWVLKIVFAKRLETIPGALDAGGADPDNARRSGPVAVTSSGDRRSRREGDGLAVVLAGAAAGYGGDRRRPVTGGAVRGSRRAVGLASEGRGEAAAPQRRDPRLNPCRLRRFTLAAHSPQLLASVLAVYGRGR